MNFVEGAPLNERNRVEVFTDDQGLYRNVQVYDVCSMMCMSKMDHENMVKASLAL